MRSTPALAAVLAVAGAAAPARASLLWDFSFSDGTNSASGTLTTNAESGSDTYTVTGAAGLFDGITVTGVAATGQGPHGTDNLLYPSPEFLDFDGVAFTLATGGPETIYGAEGGAGFFAYSTAAGAGDLGTFTASLAVPEPASSGLIAAALASLAMARRRKG